MGKWKSQLKETGTISHKPSLKFSKEAGSNAIVGRPFVHIDCKQPCLPSVPCKYPEKENVLKKEMSGLNKQIKKGNVRTQAWVTQMYTRTGKV